MAGPRLLVGNWIVTITAVCISCGGLLLLNFNEIMEAVHLDRSAGPYAVSSSSVPAPVCHRNQQRF